MNVVSRSFILKSDKPIAEALKIAAATNEKAQKALDEMLRCKLSQDNLRKVLNGAIIKLENHNE